VAAVEFKNIDKVLKFYDNQEDSNYTIYRGMKCIEIADLYTKGNKEDGYNQLEEFLKNCDNGNEYVLKMRSSKPTKEVMPSCIFKIQKVEERQQIGAYYNNNSEVLSRLASIENNLANISAESEEENYTEDEEKNFIGQILEQPGMKEMIISGIGSLIANFMQPKIEAATMPTVLAGINETDQTPAQSLKILYSKGLTENDLFILSKKTKVELNYLLKMLRS
jgi:hypothetical protein